MITHSFSKVFSSIAYAAVVNSYKIGHSFKNYFQNLQNRNTFQMETQSYKFQLSLTIAGTLEVQEVDQDLENKIVIARRCI